MASDTLTRDEVCTRASELLLTWRIEDIARTDPERAAREFGLSERGMIDGSPVNTRAQSRGVHSAIAAAAGR